MSAPEVLNARDIATLERAVKRYQSLGFEASLDIPHESQNRATIWRAEPRGGRGSDTIQLDIEKFSGEYGTSGWIVGVTRINGWSMSMTGIGQVSSHVLLFALSDAERLIDGESLPERKKSRFAPELPVEPSRDELASLSKIASELQRPERPAQRAPRKRASAILQGLDDDWLGLTASRDADRDRPDIRTR